MNTEFVKRSIPVWALSALINADYTGLEDEDIELVNKWLDETGYTWKSPARVTPEAQCR